MNCPLNLTIESLGNSFYISEKEPPDFILPPHVQSIIYHPCCMNNETSSSPDEVTIDRIIQFIRTHDRTGSGNITELSRKSLNRLFSTPCVMKDDEIIGTMLIIPFC